MDAHTKSITAPTFVDWLRAENRHHRGEVAYIAAHVTADWADGCLTATDATGVRTHTTSKHHADQHPRTRALQALDLAQFAYDRHIRQLAKACRRARYTLLLPTTTTTTTRSPR